ncbi:MAG: GntR family transcriptional regulator [Bacteroidales bacterium]|jgi:DNA-binding transcriptional regulator YhcF (GntR family)|nr:GntR family transcriptional regulator [Bacteroidales bacterium]MBQ9173282.1 GntR family transcriptional regulator [Bacteroidales bacterium]MBQ9711988.1 GntR family transcriptional regulator [Bacteroidales bacterium]
MDFDSNKPIYLQISDSLCERILGGEFKEEERIPSVREYGSSIGVNPNTVMRTYEFLTQDGIIYNKRGIGYFVSSGAKDLILARQRKAFLEEELPEIVRRMKILGIPMSVFADQEEK